MTAPVLVVKRCSACGETKPLSEFHKHSGAPDGRQSYCKPCKNASVRATQAKRRAEMGEEAWLAHQRELVRRTRDRNGNERGKALNRARTAAVAALIAAHRTEFDALLHREKYERGLI